jgi:UDPglucose 6-dehydrogenase
MNIVVIGTGYVGLVTGSCLAQLGLKVVNVDRDASKIAGLRAGKVPISEVGLEDIVAAQVKSGNLTFSTEASQALRQADIAIIAVGTPSLPDGLSDISAVEAVANQLAIEARPGTLIVMKSTVPAGTCQRLQRQMAAARNAEDLIVVSNPEFLREGSAVADFFAPDRIVIGTDDPIARAKMTELYASFSDKGVPFVMTDARTSELIKYAANGFLAMKITFINEMAHLCVALGCDVNDVASGMGLDPRIGPAFLRPGPGYGGSCFPKDVQALSALGHEANSPLRLIESVASANAYHVRRLLTQAAKFFARCWNEPNDTNSVFQGRAIAVLGLAFKANTDDVRDSASLTIIRQLLREGAKVVAYDPAANATAKRELPDLVTAPDCAEALDGADGVIIMTEWKDFADFDWAIKGKKILRCAAVADFRNILPPTDMTELGYALTNLGRKGADFRPPA